MRFINADARVTVQSFDVEHEEYKHTEMSVEDALDFATDEGCPPVISAIPVEWLCGYLHRIGMNPVDSSELIFAWMKEQAVK